MSVQWSQTPVPPVAAPIRRIEKPTWLSRPVLLVLIALPVGILMFTRGDRVVTALLAYVNCVISGWAIVHFARRQSIQMLVPILALTWTTLGFGLAYIYFAMFHPDLYYTTLHETRQHLAHGERVQLAFMLYLVTYVSITMFVQRRYAPFDTDHNVAAERRAGLALLICCIIFIGGNAVSKIVPLGPVKYVMDGLFIYFQGLTLAIGVMYTRVGKSVKLATLVFVVSVMGFYAIGNARGMALMPLVMFISGLLFYARFSAKLKLTIVLGAAISLPILLTVMNATRMITRSVGFQNIGARVEALSNWQDAQQTSFLQSTFARLYSTGGHSIISESPENVPYPGLNVPQFVQEYFGSMMPRRLQLFTPYYSSTLRLRDFYDMNVVPGQTSIEMSYLGSFWMFGGWPYIFLGGVYAATMHAVLCWWLERARRRSAYKAIVYMAIIAPAVLFAGYNLDPISYTRRIVWSMLLAFFFYHMFVKPLIGRTASVTRLAPIPTPPMRRRITP